MTAPTKPGTSLDVASKIAISMRRLGIAGLPRNYELLYEAYSGANTELAREFMALGETITQESLDELSRKYFVHHHGQGIVEDAERTIARNIEMCIKLLRREQTKLEDYGRVLDEASGRVSVSAVARRWASWVSAASHSSISARRSSRANTLFKRMNRSWMVV